MTADSALRPRRNFFLEPDVKDDGRSDTVVLFSVRKKVSPTGSPRVRVSVLKTFDSFDSHLI
jgi:hypothetical protein